MASIAVNEPAPDFTLADFEGNAFRLSGLKGQKHVVLVLNRGFM